MKNLMKLPLYDYQWVAADFMLKTKRCINLDKAGTGKTISSLAFLSKLKKQKGSVSALIVTPSVLTSQWLSETEKFSRLSAVEIDGTTNQRKKLYSKNVEIKILNYSKILVDEGELNNCKFDVVIFDEATYLKDDKTKIYSLWKNYISSIDRRVLLTATPIVNNLLEYYLIIDLLGLDIFESKDDFINDYLITDANPGIIKEKVIIFNTITGAKNLDSFKEKLKSIVLKRDVKTKLEDIKLNFINYKVLPSKEQNALFDKLKYQFINDPKRKKYFSAKVLNEMNKIASAPKVFDSSLTGYSPKVLELLKLLNSRDEQFVVYAKFTNQHENLKEVLTNSNISFVSITGKENTNSRAEAKEKFYSGEAKVMLITTAGKYGLNLQAANNLVLLDIPQTPSDLEQLIARVYRTGQKKKVVNVYQYYLYNTVDNYLLDKLIAKQRLIDNYFEKDTISKIFSNIDRPNNTYYLDINYAKNIYYEAS